MKKNYDIQDVFKSRFDSFEPNVDNKIWINIEKNIGANEKLNFPSSTSNFFINNIISCSFAAATIIFLIVGNSIFMNRINKVNHKLKTSTLNQKSIKPNQVNNNTFIIENEVTDNIEPEALNNNNKPKNTDSSINTNRSKQKNNYTIKKQNNLHIDSTNFNNEFITDNEKAFYKTAVTQNNQKKNNSFDSNKNNKKIQKKNKITTKAKEIKKKNRILEEQKNEILIEKNISNIEIPNVFSPNNDFINDVFKLKSHNAIKEFKVIITNDKGKVLFSSENINFEWNGQNLQGESVPQGLYVCVINALGNDGRVFKFAEQINLLRR